MLISDWRRVVRKAWSFRLSIIAGLLSSAAAVMAVFLSPDSGVFYVLAFMAVSISASVSGFAAAAARVTYQARLHDDT